MADVASTSFNIPSFLTNNMKDITIGFDSPDNKASQTMLLKSLNITTMVNNEEISQAAAIALRILEPAATKLTTIETQRIIECIDECIRRHELITSLLYILLTDDKKMNQYCLGLGNDLLTDIKLHKITCDNLNSEMEEYPHSKHTALKVLVSETCKNILRMFEESPAVAAAIRSELDDEDIDEKVETIERALDMIEALYELRCIMFEWLLTTPWEVSERSCFMEIISKRGKNNEVLIAKLQAQLDVATEDKNDAIEKKDVIIRRLKTELHQIEQFSAEKFRRTEKDAKKQAASDSRVSGVKQDQKIAEVEKLKREFDVMLQKNREMEQRRRKKKFKIETEVENWINKYDQDMGDKQDEKEQIDDIQSGLKKEIAKLQEKFDILKLDYDKIMAARRKALAEKEAREARFRRRNQAASTIQAFYRSHRIRKWIKAKSKKKKKGKKGKKKGKGKKKR